MAVFSVYELGLYKVLKRGWGEWKSKWKTGKETKKKIYMFGFNFGN